MKPCLKCHQPIQDPVHGLHMDCFVQEFELPAASSIDFSDVSLKSFPLDSSRAHPMNTSFFQGKFKKYAARLDGRSYILKVMDEDYPELPRVEYLCNQIARALALPVSHFHFIRFMNEVEAFVVRNFMDYYIPGNLIHIYHFLDEGQSFSCQNLMQVVKDKVRRMDAMRQFVDMCLLDALIGNHDRHGRNIALIETPKGYTLAPLYDNPSYLGIEDEKLLFAQHRPRGKIATSFTDEPTMKDYVEELMQMGYTAWVQDFHRRVQNVPLHNMITQSFVSDKRQQALSNLIEQRIKEMNDALVS